MKVNRKQIIEILDDSQFWQPDMIIERKDPFFWRLSKRWLNTKAKELMELFNKK